MIKTSIKEHLDAEIKPFEEDIKLYKAGIDLAADIMLSLKIRRLENHKTSSKFNLNHELSFILVETKKYDEEYDLVEGSGIYVPKEQKIAEISFIKPSELEKLASQSIDNLTLRDDEEWGDVYAQHAAVLTAFRSAMSAIEHWENQEIKIPGTDDKKQTIVSVAGLGTYFHRFKHYKPDNRKEHDNYNSDKNRKQEFANLAFLPGEPIIVNANKEHHFIC